jgi:hypothetical protein
VDDDRLKLEDRAEPAEGVGVRQIKIRLMPDSDVEPQVVNDIIVNFTGDQFVVAFARVFPPTFRGADELPEELESKVLFRAAISTRKWAEAVKSITEQLVKLKEAGVLPELAVESEEGA